MASRQLEKFVNFFSQFFPPSPSPPVITFIKEPSCNTSQAGKKKGKKRVCNKIGLWNDLRYHWIGDGKEAALSWHPLQFWQIQQHAVLHVHGWVCLWQWWGGTWNQRCAQILLFLIYAFKMHTKVLQTFKAPRCPALCFGHGAPASFSPIKYI